MLVLSMFRLRLVFYPAHDTFVVRRGFISPQSGGGERGHKLVGGHRFVPG